MTQTPDETPDQTPDHDSDTSSETGAGSSTDTGSSDDGATDGLDQGGPGDIGDADLPEDLRPSEDNPLAKHPEQTGDEDDVIGADREEAPQTAPMTAADADYGSGGGDAPGDGRANAAEDDGSDTLDNGGGGAG